MRWIALAFLPLTASAQSLPDGSFFTGSYDMIGRAADGLYDDTLDVSGDDWPLTLSSCRHGTGSLDLATPDHEGAAPLAGDLNGQPIACRFLIDGDNYPVLNCYRAEAEGYGLVTLWPRHEAVSACN